MIIPARRQAEVVGVLALVAIGVFSVRGWLSAHDARIRSEEQTRAKDAAIHTLGDQQKTRDQQLVGKLAEIAASKKSVQTPKQAAVAIPKALTGVLPQPVTVTLPDDLTEPATVSVPQLDLKPAYDAIQECRACLVERETLRADLTDERSKTQALTDEVATWKRTAKGGSVWLRLGRTVKIVLFTAAVTAGAMCGTGHCR